MTDPFKQFDYIVAVQEPSGTWLPDSLNLTRIGAERSAEHWSRVMETPHAVINFGVGYGLPTYLPFIKGIYAG